MDALIIDARDAALIQQRTRYEAQHRAVTTLLMERLHYHVADSEWLTVFA